MKTIFWDEHTSPIEGIPVLNNKCGKTVWFYVAEPEFKTFLLYHNVEI